MMNIESDGVCVCETQKYLDIFWTEENNCKIIKFVPW